MKIKHKVKLLQLFVSISAILQLFPIESRAESSDEELNVAIGPNKAIQEYTPSTGLKLSEQAIRALKVKLVHYYTSTIQIPKFALVKSGDFKGIYRLRNDFYKLTPVKLVTEEKDSYVLELSNFKSGDQYVISNTDLIRVAEIYAASKGQLKND